MGDSTDWYLSAGPKPLWYLGSHRRGLGNDEHTYPYDAHDGREDPNSQELVVLRGGSWIDDPPVRVTERDESRNGPYLSFRLACSPQKEAL
jgi:hypothetical protein